MGSEFLKKTRNTNAKNLNKGRVALATPDLFTQTPINQARSVVAKLHNGSALTCGEKVIVETNGGSLQAVVGHRTVATFLNPPAEVFSAISESGGVAKGEVCKINPISKTADIILC